ncbi:phage tail assembly chaperone [Paracoccus liaowanqingii]|uniref:Phage tail assembly chaperone n=1 Tax=Paracoccus liaowanqingii TaxID=2560053 RepID=A0A4P7HJR8_9RHOB|nr:rcc01693 family protein [Paracoccus liaowanqingii]QBX34408.1 phage tail assembly chaperone [Paracoccus liaowanqingii]
MSGGAGSGGAGLDWAGLMRAGLRDLRLHPDQFWALTPAELGLMLGLGPAGLPRMTRDRLAGLAARYPDASGPSGARTDEPRGQDDGDG